MEAAPVARTTKSLKERGEFFSVSCTSQGVLSFRKRCWVGLPFVRHRKPVTLLQAATPNFQGPSHGANERSNLKQTFWSMQRLSATGAAAMEVPSSDWQEPSTDAKLSTADRAVLALVRASTNLSDKTLANRAAAAHGLTLITSSDVCLAPLLPPFGFTVEEDGEAGDGMTLPPPSRPPPHKRGGASGGVTSQSNTLSGSASALLNAVFPNHPHTTPITSTPTAASHSTNGASYGMLPLLSSNPSASSSPYHTPQPTPKRPIGSSNSAHPEDNAQRLSLAHLVSEGGGGDDEQDNGDTRVGGGNDGIIADGSARIGYGYGYGNRTGGSGSGGGGAATAPGLVGVAAAALSALTQAASSATAGPAAVPVGRLTAGAATAAAQAARAAVARAVRATTQLLPAVGEPSSSWLVADDQHSGVRYIVIAAGPDLRRRFAADLTTDLVPFEAQQLGARINKRLYGEALALYGRFMPLVMDYLEAVPDGNICFGGQGLGGSLAVVLQLMACHRGLRFARLLPAVAVDAPAVLAQVPVSRKPKAWAGAEREQPPEPLEDVLEDLLSRSVLEELGLPHDAVRNVLLTRPPPPHMPQLHHPHHPHKDIGSSAPHSPSESPATHASFIVMGAPPPAAAISTTGSGGAGASGLARALDPQHAQVFRLLGKVIDVRTPLSSSLVNKNSRPARTHNVTSSVAQEEGPAVLRMSGGGGAGAGGAADGVLETDGGSGEVSNRVSVAAATESGYGAGFKRLDELGSIASAAATAAAGRLWAVGAGALRAAATASTAAGTGRVSAVAATARMVGKGDQKAGGVKVGEWAAGQTAVAVAAMFSGAAGSGISVEPSGSESGYGSEEDVGAWGI